MIGFLVGWRSNHYSVELWQNWQRSEGSKQHIMDRHGVGVRWAASSRNKPVLTMGRYYSYFLTLTSFQPLYGRLSDIFGRKPALLFGYAIFGLGCLFCGLARNMNELIAARVCIRKCNFIEMQYPLTLIGIRWDRRWRDDDSCFYHDE